MRQIDFKVSAVDNITVHKHITRYIFHEIKMQQSNGRLSKLKRFFVDIIPFIIFIFPLMVFIDNNPTSINICVGYFIAIIFFIEFVYSKVKQKKYLKFHDLQLRKVGPTSIIIGEHGIEARNDRYQIIYKWQAIVSIDQWKNYIYFRSQQYDGIFIPVRAFASQEEMSSFLSEARTYLPNQA